MQDPLAENITGEKRIVHTVEHRINWGYALLGAAGIFGLWVVFCGDSDPDDDDFGEASL